MQELGFLQDFAVVMLVAGVVTLLFRRLKQPVVLGYLLAGFLIGPFTPPFPLVRDLATIRTMADLGVIVLMFSLGLDFNLRKLGAVGRPAFVVALVEITIMVLVGYEVARLLGWPPADRALLGVALALTSTTIVVKSLRDRGELNQPHGRLISGVAIYDDIFVILVMILLPGFARTGSLPTGQLLLTLLGLFVFLVAAIVVGLLLAPRLVRFVSRFNSDELLLVLSLGLCFGMALLAVKLGFSSALGAFLMGGILAETREHGRIGALTAPIRDMFSAVFFVSIGMLIDPRQVLAHGGTVLAVTAVYLVAKTGACAAGTLVAGYSGRDALRVGTGMAQVGEFAFVLAAIAASLHLSSDHLSPVIVSVATINALVRPYLVDNAERIADFLGRRIPGPVRAAAAIYARWLADTRAGPGRSPAMRIIRSVVWQIALNLALIAGAFVVAALAARLLPRHLLPLPESWGGLPTLCWVAALLLSLPVYVVTVRKMQATAMMLAEVTVRDTGPRSLVARTLVMHTLFALGNGALLLLTLAVSAPLLPPTKLLLLLLLVVALVLLRYGQLMNRWYSRAKFSLVETWNQPPEPEADARTSQQSLIREAELTMVAIPGEAAPGRLIRELELRTRTGASIVAIERNGLRVVNPGPDEEVLAGDQVLLLGSPDQLARATELLKKDGAAE
jgi:CPA2 family monovalent cation:H+ antiporter-2